MTRLYNRLVTSDRKVERFTNRRDAWVAFRDAVNRDAVKVELWWGDQLIGEIARRSGYEGGEGQPQESGEAGGA